VDAGIDGGTLEPTASIPELGRRIVVRRLKLGKDLEVVHFHFTLKEFQDESI